MSVHFGETNQPVSDASPPPAETLLTHFRGILFATDREGTVTLEHGRGLPGLRVRRGELVGRSIFEAFAPIPSFLEGTHRALRGEPFAATAELENTVFEYWCEPLRNERGEVSGLAGGAIDITVCWETRAALHRTSETLNAIVQASPIAIVTLDLEGRVMTWNPAAERMHGWSEEEVAGQPIPVLPEAMRQDIGAVQKRIFDEGGVTNLEHPCFRKDGSMVQASLSAAPLRSQSGELTGAVYLVTDITEQKRTQRALESAKEKAEAASRAKSEFLANMSHEIRTPMNGVLGMTELALGTDLTGEQREYLTCAKSSAEALLKLLNDILDFSKIEAGKLALSTEEFDVREGLAATMKTLAVRAHQKGLELVYEVDAGVPEVVAGDFPRVRQMLVNLIDNSIKFTPAGEVFVQVKLLTRQKGEAVLQFSVADTGIGIPLEKQAEIFEAFTQADGSITRRFGGTGLGLSISSQLARLMGGSIALESEPAQGSRFHLTIPFAVPPAGAAGMESVRAGSRRLRVLVADGNPTSRSVVARLLEAAQMEAAPAAGGSEAWRMIQAAREAGQPFDLVLADAHLQEMDGLTLARRIKQDGPGAATVLMLNSLDRPETGQWQESGIEAYLVKPAGRSELLGAVQQAMNASARLQPARKEPTPASAAERRQGRVLLVEDNPVNRGLLVRLLEKRGYSVATAQDGVEALAVQRSQAFDLILMDVQMPRMDGLEASTRIRQREAENGEHVPIVALTAHAMNGDRERCLEAGMDEYVSKPVNFQELFDKIDQVRLRGNAARQNEPAL